MKQRLFIATVFIAALIASIYALSREPSAPPRDRIADVPPPQAPSVGDTDVTENQTSSGWVTPRVGERTLRAIVDGSTVKARFVLGIAGTHPAMQAEGLEIGLPELDDAVSLFEARVTATDGTRAFWGTLDTAASSVELEAVASARIAVESGDGAPVADARVRLARDPIALILETVDTSVDGIASFDSLPPGAYHVSVEAPGFVTSTGTVELPPSGLATTITVDRGARISGLVTGRGSPVAGARVLVYVDRANTGSAHQLVPEAVVETDGEGKWATNSLPIGPTSVMIVAQNWAPRRSKVIDTTAVLEAPRFDVELERGLAATVFVVDAQGRPVADAAVLWSDPASGAGATRRSDAQGRVMIDGLPSTATLRATFAEWQSSWVEISAVPDTQHVELQLERFDASKIWRVRIRPPIGTEVLGVTATDATGRRCVSESIGGLDFVLRGCGPGMLQLSASTSVGTSVVSTQAADGIEVTLPPPTEVELNVRGAAGEDWPATTFTMSDGADALFELDARPSDQRSVIVTTAVYPGSWTLLVSNERVGTRDFTVEVTDRPTSETFALQDRGRIRVWAVDRYDSPITGAWAMLFQGERFIDAARTGGQLPAEFSVKAPWTGDVIIVDPRVGEGTVSVSVDAEGKFEQRIQLSAPVQSLKIPATRPDTNEVESRLGARLVRDDDSLVLDFDRTGAPGAAAGLQRGDRLVTAWPVEDAMRVVIFRDGAGYVDATVR